MRRILERYRQGGGEFGFLFSSVGVDVYQDLTFALLPSYPAIGPIHSGNTQIQDRTLVIKMFLMGICRRKSHPPSIRELVLIFFASQPVSRLILDSRGRCCGIRIVGHKDLNGIVLRAVLQFRLIRVEIVS